MGDMLDFTERTRRAQREIAAILGRLEREQGMVIDAVHLTAIEVTALEDTRPRFIRGVAIDLKRMDEPGEGWET